MKNLIKSIFLFSVFAILFYCSAILVIGKTLPKLLKGYVLTENKISARDLSEVRFKNAEISQPVDIMILGSSHAYRGYDVRLFKKAGYSAYNLGSSSQKLMLTNFIYNKYVNNLAPKKLIIDIYPILLSKIGGESELNVLPLFYNDPLFIKEAFQTGDLRIINSLIYFQVFGDTNKIKSKKRKNEEYISGGYISSSKTDTNSERYKIQQIEINEKNILALKNIVTDARKRGIKVYLFQAPLCEACYKSYKNNKAIDSILHSIGNYYNYNEQNVLPINYFFDDSHINQKGVDVYNKWVIEKLKENE